MRRLSLLLAVLLLLPLVPLMTHASTIPVLSPSTITISNDGYYTVKLYGQSLTYWNSSSSVLDISGANYNEPYPSYFSTPNGIEMVDETNFVCSGGSWWATTVTYPVSYLFGNSANWYVNSTWIVEGSSGSGAQLFIT
uniref:Uncharacterized protein n=2 Tax=Metallosphaera hakonensis TaxID=79601 RepID=A0A2U9ITS2_9CREN